MSDPETSSVIVAYLEHRFQNKDMMFLIYYLFLSHIKRYKLILQAYKKIQSGWSWFGDNLSSKVSHVFESPCFVHWHSPSTKIQWLVISCQEPTRLRSEVRQIMCVRSLLKGLSWKLWMTLLVNDCLLEQQQMLDADARMEGIVFFLFQKKIALNQGKL